MVIRHATANMLSGPAVLSILPGQWAALMLRIDGSTGAAPPTAASFGLIRGRIQSRPFYSVTWSATQEINRMDLGEVEDAIGAGGGNPVAHSCMIVASRTGDGNIFDIDEDDDSAIEVDLSGIAAGNLASGTIQLYGIPQEGQQMYIPQMFTRQPNIAASSTDIVRFKEENVSHLYLVGLANLDRLLLIKDGEVKANAEFAALLAASNMDARLEAAFTTALRLDLHKSGALTEAMSDSFELTLTTDSGGVGNPELIPVALDFTPDALVRSTALVEAKAAMVLQRKAETGKARAVTIIQALTTARVA